MTPINPTTHTRDTANENHPSPALATHTGQTSLCHNKLTPRVNFHNSIPIIFFHILNITDTSAETGVGDEDGNCLVLG